MAREKLMLEGPDAHPTRYFHTGSVRWMENQPYAVMSFQEPTLLIGKATDFQRDDAGWISAEIEWYVPEYSEMSWHFGIHVSPVKYFYGRKQRLHVTECWVNAVIIELNGANPHGLMPPRE